MQEVSETMTRIRLRWAAALSLAMALPAAAVHGADPWWVIKPRPGAAPAPAVSIGRPVPTASLGKPVPIPAAEAGWNTPPAPVVEAGWNVPAPPLSPSAPAEGWNSTAKPVSYEAASGGMLAPRLVRGQPADPPPPGSLTGPPPVAAPAPPFGDPGFNPGVLVDQPIHHGFCDGMKDWFNFGSRPSAGGGLFKSDHFCDDSLISPVTNPFFFEDPRSLTEIKPLFIIQKAPKDHGGGNDEFYGIQGRLALTEQLSLVVNKLGFVSLNPDQANAGYSKKTGFAEVNFGPKFTFWRDENFRNAAAVGLNIEAPIGSKSVFQDTGTLGLDPYVTYGQSFGRSSFGSFDFIGEAGYSFAVDSKRSEFVHSSLHLDYDVLNAHRWYPLLEMNYFHYTKSGRNTTLNGFDGVDLVNFGSSNVGKRDFVSLAPGLRYKFNENVIVGGAVEFPLTTQKELQDFRFTLDVIFRY
jgi:Putative MetA-pathway of phenol degradation